MALVQENVHILRMMAVYYLLIINQIHLLDMGIHLKAGLKKMVINLLLINQLQEIMCYMMSGLQLIIVLILI